MEDDEWGACMGWWFTIAGELYTRVAPMSPADLGKQHDEAEIRTHCWRKSDSNLPSFLGLVPHMLRLWVAVPQL
jgi:hypothetical protein